MMAASPAPSLDHALVADWRAGVDRLDPCDTRMPGIRAARCAPRWEAPPWPSVITGLTEFCATTMLVTAHVEP